MGITVTFIGILPPAREDERPWTGVRIEEAPASAGPWTLIDTQVLGSPDPDPSLPQPRNLTTDNGTLDNGWYRFTFTDDFAGSSQPSVPMLNGLPLVLPPSADVIRNLSPLLRQRYPLPPKDQYAMNDLQMLVKQATAEVQSITWRLIDPDLGDSSPEGYVSEAVPSALVPIAIQAISRVSERIAITTEPAFAQQVATGRRMRGFSAGPYSESYFAPGEFARRGASQGRQPMDSDDAVDSALWALATEDARDYFVWRATGVAPPVGVATSFDYRRQSLGYTGGGLPVIGAHGGPDGF